MSRLLRVLFWLILMPTAAMAGGHAAEPVTTDPGRQQLVILVRHAEKVLDQSKDPALTDAGLARANTLASVLRHAGVAAIITTEWQRTRATAAPLAKLSGITPIVVSTAASSTPPHAEQVAAAVRAQAADVVLVVGHSNTVPAIIKALGGPAIAEIGDTEYDNLYTLWVRTGQARLIESKY